MQRMIGVFRRAAARIRREERGASALELGFALPLLALLLAAAVPVVQSGIGYMAATRAAAAGVRYASRADENARRAPDGTLTRRPTAAEVEAFVVQAAGPVTPTSVQTFVSGQPADPSSALPGEAVHVVVSYEVSFGPLAGVANAIASVIDPGSGGVLPVSKVVTVSAAGREE